MFRVLGRRAQARLDNKQYLLEMDDPLERLEYLFSTLEGLQIS